VKRKREHVNNQWNDNEAENSGTQMSRKGKLQGRLA
jgi:hypothetical protein